MAEDLALNIYSKIKEYINLNKRIMHQVEKAFIAGEAITEQVKNLKYKTYWLILTEPWCGDASQTLPAFNKLAELSEGKIEMKLVHREQNDELMSAYLTNGTRSIPKLIQLDEPYNVTGIWRPRRTVVLRLVQELKSIPVTASANATIASLVCLKQTASTGSRNF